jgi:hypothetical protein
MALNAGLNVIDQGHLFCSNNTQKTCIYAVSAMVIVGSGSSANQWSICAVVDGKTANPACATQPDVPTEHPVTGTSLQLFKVKSGRQHTVGLQVYVSAPATLEGWSAVYQEYPGY